MLLYYCILHFPSLFFKERDVRRGQGEFVLGKFERWYEKGNLSYPLFLCALVAKMYLYYFVTVYQRIRSGLYLGHEQSSNNRYWGIFMYRQKP